VIVNKGIYAFSVWGDAMKEMMDPFDFVAWNPAYSSATAVEISRWQKLIKKGYYDAYYQCFRIFYDIIACLVLSNMVYMMLRQLVHC
jgi:hypothetical protein